jgi:hypothetical protein
MNTTILLKFFLKFGHSIEWSATDLYACLVPTTLAQLLAWHSQQSCHALASVYLPIRASLRSRDCYIVCGLRANVVTPINLQMLR